MGALTLYFGGYRYDEKRKCLASKIGQEKRLRAQSLAVFVELARAHNQIVSREQLTDKIWPAVHVTDDSISACVSDIRKALADSKRTILKTVPRQGYMLISDKPPEIQPITNEEIAPRSRVNPPKVAFLLIGAALGIVCIGYSVSKGMVKGESNAIDRLTAGLNSSADLEQEAERAEIQPAILVTEFDNLTSEPRWARLASGLTSGLVVELARNSWLRILRSESEDQLSDEIRKVTNPRFVISGTLQAEAEHLRITSQLKEILSNEIIWSERWDRPAQELFSVQDEILDKINSSIGGAWTGVVAKHGLSQADRKPTNSLDAYESYLLGVEYKHKFTPENNKESIKFLKKAVSIDPRFGQAWSTLSIVYMNSSGSVTSENEAQELIEKQMEAASKAYELIPENPEAIISIAGSKHITAIRRQ